MVNPMAPLAPEPTVGNDQRETLVAYVALGANLGNAAAALAGAVDALQALPLTSVTKTSSIFKTAALDSESLSDASPDYLNAVVELQTSLAAPVLLHHLQQIEQKAGRERAYVNAPRTLDLDLLLYGSGVIYSHSLTIPHPRMLQRAFVLVPLAEIAPDLVDRVHLAAVAGQRIERWGPLVGPP